MSFLPAPTLVAAAMATSSPTQSAAGTVPVAGVPAAGTADNSEPGINAPSAVGASNVTEGSPSKLASGERRGSSIVASAFGLSEGGPGLGGSFPQQPFPVAGFPVGGLTVVGGPVSGSAGGGGLASSPNVPRPGTSIDPATGKPHTAGLTRAELDAKKAAAAAELSGREQAAKQLTGGLGEAAITPGKELPGGWGPIKPVGAPGTGPNATTSIEEDIENALNKVGQAAFSLVPNSVKEALGNSPTSKTGATPGTSPTARRGSGAGFLDAAMQQANKLTHDLTVSGKKATEFVGAQVKELVDELKTAPGNRLSMSGPGEVRAVGATAVAPRTSLPSDEPAGALPGEHTSGVGALPGPSTETGVAVLPDEKNIASSSSLQNQAPRPGEVAVAPRVSLPSEEPAGALPGEHTTGVGALPGSANETGVAVLPEERAHPDPLAESAANASGASRAADSAASAPSSGIHPGIGLAAPLPAAPLGDGAAGGATDLEATPGVSTASVVSAPVTDSGSPTTPNGHSGGVVPETRHANDRTTSMASVTAIRAGHEGERPSEGDVLDRSSTTSASPLSKSAIIAGAAAATAAGGGATTAAVASANGDKHADGTGATGTKQAVSLTPGNEHEAVGHPSMRDTPGATRTPGTYPVADLNGKAEGTEKVINKTTTAGHHDTTTAASAGAPSTTAAGVATATPSAAKSSTTTPNGTTAAAKTTDDTHHRRKSSGASATKKKVGFMHKLKGEMKVISGKLTKDESKVEVGEKMKHGEL